jgi:hypothetical protein
MATTQVNPGIYNPYQLSAANPAQRPWTGGYADAANTRMPTGMDVPTGTPTFSDSQLSYLNPHITMPAYIFFRRVMFGVRAILPFVMDDKQHQFHTQRYLQGRLDPLPELSTPNTFTAYVEATHARSERYGAGMFWEENFKDTPAGEDYYSAQLAAFVSATEATVHESAMLHLLSCPTIYALFFAVKHRSQISKPHVMELLNFQNSVFGCVHDHVKFKGLITTVMQYFPNEPRPDVMIASKLTVAHLQTSIATAPLTLHETIIDFLKVSPEAYVTDMKVGMYNNIKLYMDLNDALSGGLLGGNTLERENVIKGQYAVYPIPSSTVPAEEYTADKRDIEYVNYAEGRWERGYYAEDLKSAFPKDHMTDGLTAGKKKYCLGDYLAQEFASLSTNRDGRRTRFLRNVLYCAQTLASPAMNVAYKQYATEIGKGQKFPAASVAVPMIGRVLPTAYAGTDSMNTGDTWQDTAYFNTKKLTGVMKNLATELDKMDAREETKWAIGILFSIAFNADALEHFHNCNVCIPLGVYKIRPEMRFTTSSAILAIPGMDTGYVWFVRSSFMKGANATNQSGAASYAIEFGVMLKTEGRRRVVVLPDIEIVSADGGIGSRSAEDPASFSHTEHDVTAIITGPSDSMERYALPATGMYEGTVLQQLIPQGNVYGNWLSPITALVYGRTDTGDAVADDFIDAGSLSGSIILSELRQGNHGLQAFAQELEGMNDRPILHTPNANLLNNICMQMHQKFPSLKTEIQGASFLGPIESTETATTLFTNNFMGAMKPVRVMNV